ncbi:MAG: serine acetyltransferase [Verrucomicrobiota bacterium JB024]|nr:serine acetyltransferase [Verrucomicrobiota bacterium JB024]
MKAFYRKLLRYLFGTDLHIIGMYRLMHACYKKPVLGPTLAQAIRCFIRIYASCDIAPSAVIGRNLRLPHPLCIVIGDKVQIGDNVMIWQQCTLGSHGRKELECDYPVIEDGVRIYTGATVIGGIRLGKGCRIGAHALVTHDVPAEKTAVGIPAKIID